MPCCPPATGHIVHQAPRGPVGLAAPSARQQGHVPVDSPSARHPNRVLTTPEPDSPTLTRDGAPSPVRAPGSARPSVSHTQAGSCRPAVPVVRSPPWPRPDVWAGRWGVIGSAASEFVPPRRDQRRVCATAIRPTMPNPPEHWDNACRRPAFPQVRHRLVERRLRVPPELLPNPLAALFHSSQEKRRDRFFGRGRSSDGSDPLRRRRSPVAAGDLQSFR